MRTKWLYIAGIILVAGLITQVLWPRFGAPTTITLFVTGDTRGYLEPCGCRRDQAGGLPGRMTLVKQNTQGAPLLVDVGNLTSGGRSYELLKLRYLLTGMQRMGYSAINLGRREAGLDRDTLQTILRDSGAPFVSCNVLSSQTGQPLTKPYIVQNVAGVRIGFTGVAQAPEDEVGPGVRIRPPGEALADTLPRMKRECDYMVVLAFVDQDTITALASRFHEIDCILGGDVPQSSEKADTQNRAVSFSVTDKGKVLGRLVFRRQAGRLALQQSNALKVGDTTPPATEMVALLKQYKQDLRARNVELANDEGLDPVVGAITTADAYVGIDACVRCHPRAYAISNHSAHAHAYDTLTQKGSQYDPECLKCHSVGYGARDGFINLERSSALAGVQCESCHGRGGEHVKAQQARKKRISTFHPVTPNTCVHCHDRENSENFNYARYWPKIAHGKQ